MTHLPSALLLALLLAVVAIAASVIHDTAQGFCLTLEPCHTAQEDTQR